MTKTFARATAALGLLVLSGCVTAPPPPSPSQPPPSSAYQDMTAAAPVALKIAGVKTSPAGIGNQTLNDKLQDSIVRYLGWDTRGWSRNKSAYSVAGYYTRMELYSPGEVGGTESDTANLRSYDKEKRSWLARLLASETDNVTTLINVEVKDPELKVAIPLFSIAHSSGDGKEDTWTTKYTESYVESPLFLVGPDTAIVIHLDTNASKEVKSDAATAVISAVTQAVKIAAPSSSLLTSLSRPEINNAAVAIDTSLSSLFSYTQDEDVGLGRFADTWAPGSAINLAGCAPFVKFDRDSSGASDCGGSAGSHDAKIGNWNLELRCPQISIFDSQDICHKPDGTPSPSPVSLADIGTEKTAIGLKVRYGTVLTFMLSSQVTIQSFVQSQSWYTNFIKAPTADGAVADFCSNLVSGSSSLTTSGLNDFDAALVLKAAINTMSGVAKYKSQFSSDQTCKGFLDRENVTL